MESQVTCEDCGLEFKRLPRVKKCPRCKRKVFIYLSKDGDKELDFRSKKEVENDEDNNRYYHGYMMNMT